MAQIVSNISNQPPAVGTPVASGPLVERFIVRRPVEGLQIVIEYTLNPSVQRLKIVRKRYSYPENLTDGLEILDMSSPPSQGFFIDENIDEGIVYYYTAFVQDNGGNWWTDRAWRGWSFNCKTGFFREKLYMLLPQAYRTEDRGSKTYAFSKQTVTDFKELFHVNETGELKYELQRLLSLFGTFLDDVKCLIDFIPILYDVDNAPPLTLPHIASVVGVVFNYDLPVDRQRVEIREAVNTYKLKGTKQGIISHVQKITGFATEVEEMIYRIAISNREDRLTLEPSLYNAQHANSCGDLLTYTVDFSGGIYSNEKILICTLVPQDKQLEQRIVNKLIRTLRDWIPADTIAVVQFKSEYVDDIESPIPFSDVLSGLTTALTFMLSNTSGHVTNDPNIVTAII